jgi:hypothetical protein
MSTEPPFDSRIDNRDPTYVIGDARATTEHEVARPTTPGQPTNPTEPTDLQGEPPQGDEAPQVAIVPPFVCRCECHLPIGFVLPAGRKPPPIMRPCGKCKDDHDQHPIVPPFDSCVYCEEPLLGNVAPGVIGTPEGIRHGHIECSLREVLGGIGHLIAHDYWCTERHDPDAGLTYRQSALLVDAFVRAVGVEEAAGRG